jgi:hypothetical protein
VTAQEKVEAYFRVDNPSARVWLVQTFTPGLGWEPVPKPRARRKDGRTMTPRLPGIRLGALARAGVTAIACTDGTRIADFRLDELRRRSA